MIKKNTKIIFKDRKDSIIEELAGGIPLSKDDIVKVHKNKAFVEYKVIDKTVDYFLEGTDQVVNITYTLRALKD